MNEQERATVMQAAHELERLVATQSALLTSMEGHERRLAAAGSLLGEAVGQMRRIAPLVSQVDEPLATPLAEALAELMHTLLRLAQQLIRLRIEPPVGEEDPDG